MTNENQIRPRKGKGFLVKLLIGLILIGIGGGGAFALVESGVLGHQSDEKQDKIPKLVLKGEEDPYAPVSEKGGKEGGETLEYPGEGGGKYRTTYFNFSEEFTSNLKNSPTLIQVGLAASTRRDGRVIMWMKKHEMAIRSELLSVLADTSEEEVFSIEGKARLQKRMTNAINAVLTKNEGFGGVDSVYFKSFLVQ